MARFKGALTGLIPVIIMALILFISSGRLDWIMAWLLLGIHMVGTIFISLKISSELIDERVQEKDGIKNWDVILVRVMNMVGLAVLLVAGLDIRFGWSGSFPLLVEIIAMAVVIVGYVILAWAAISNDYFSRVVRIQEERGHSVITGGPYRYIRHPGYLGLILCAIAQPAMLGSLWALIPAIFTVIILLVRTNLEDKTLQDELAGYKDYILQVRYRLFLGVW
ncbi:methyltransferase family protein [Methanobacterium sp.]|uniref:methyltransferase family protein n=1 Tax=Methanobacterium sp. TaxID=2164 RepID=UPI003C714524